MRDELELNLRRWNRAAEIHLTKNVYGVESFKAGECRLHRVEVEEVGDVRGKSLLHLQCHFGIDTLSWARRGATVTGVDFSPTAIDAARALAGETNLPATFVCASIDDVIDKLPGGGRFDIVFTSYGVLCWLPSLKPWAAAIAHFLEPGGFFYIVEAHPTARIFPTDADTETPGELRPMFSYFHDPAGMRFPGGTDYADPTQINDIGEHSWQHSMADVINSLIAAGLTIEFLHEFPYCAWEVVTGCIEVEKTGVCQSYFGRMPGEPQLPLMFSLKATRKTA